MTADCSTCNRRAKFRLDAYDTAGFPAEGQGLACREHLAAAVLSLEKHLAQLDDTDALCVSVLDEAITHEWIAVGKELYARPPLPETLAARTKAGWSR